MNVKFSNSMKQACIRLTSAYVLVMFSIFLFYFRNYYFDMTPSKYSFFQCVTLVLLGCCMVLSILQLIKSKERKSLKMVIRELSICDWAFLGMLASHCITTLLSEYQMASLTGSNGRQLGLIFTFLITLVYFNVSRHYEHDQKTYLIFLGSCALVICLGILNFYGIDPFHFFNQLSDFDTQRFLSTIGNITFFAHLICLSLPFSIIFYTYSTDHTSSILYAISTGIGFMGIFISNLDGAYLGIFALMFFYFMICCVSYEKMKRFFEVLLIALVSAKLLYSISSFFPEAGRGFATISYLIVSSPISSIALVLLCGCYIWYVRKDAFWRKVPFQKIRRILFVLIVSFVILMIGCMLYFTFIDTETDLGFASNYMRFSDAWGTGRGFIWSRLFPFYFDGFDAIQKLFGYGLDTTRYIMVNNFTAGDIGAYDNAHNEYLQYLMTSGLVGLCTYLTVLISVQVRLFQKSENDPYMLAILGALVAHSFQAITGLNQPITTPLVFLLIALGESYIRHKKKEIPETES